MMGQKGLAVEFVLLLAFCALCSACGAINAGQRSLEYLSTPEPQTVPDNPTLPPLASPAPTFSATLNPMPPSPSPSPPPGVWAAPYIPLPLANALVSFIQSEGQDQWIRSAHAAEATVRLEASYDQPVSYWVLALVAPFPTLLDGVSFEELRHAWNGDASALFNGSPLLMDQTTRDLIAAWWGEPAAQAVEMLPADELLEHAWESRTSWAIVPFQSLEPRWKVLEVAGVSPIHPFFEMETYPLSVPFSFTGENSERLIQASQQIRLPVSNWEADKLTVLALTGVTALVRGTALTMEQRGTTYPAQDIRNWLHQADLVHVNNEVPFYPDCPLPVLYPEELRFCSDPRYIELLEDIGTSIVEMSGDHMGDFGPEAVTYTLEMYTERGWAYYGGGANAGEARQPLLLEHNSNRLALLGCNAKGIPYYAPASDTQPGAVACDFDWLYQEISRLRGEGYLPVVTYQHREYESFIAPPEMRPDFLGAAEAGAVIVSGSQAHIPHGMEFHAGAFIHYGLGNLFFDQFHYYADYRADRAFIDRHIFYDGRHINTELLTIQFVDLARSRLTTPQERLNFLEVIFAASGW